MRNGILPAQIDREEAIEIAIKNRAGKEWG
jgi:hypothetical protein